MEKERQEEVHAHVTICKIEQLQSGSPLDASTL